MNTKHKKIDNTALFKIAEKMIDIDIEKELEAKGLTGKKLNDIGFSKIAQTVEAALKKYGAIVTDSIRICPIQWTVKMSVTSIVAKEIVARNE